MWFGLKREVAPLYKDETMRRAFATASGRPKGAEKLKKLKLADSKSPRGWRERFLARPK
jgi:hypothetical protein